MDFMRIGHLDTWQAHATAWTFGYSGGSSKAGTPPPIVFPPFPLPLQTPLSPPAPPPPTRGPQPPPRKRGLRSPLPPPRPRWDSDGCNDDEDDDDDDNDNVDGGWGIVKRSRPGSASTSHLPMHHVWLLNNSESYGHLSDAFAFRLPPPLAPPQAPPRMLVASPGCSQMIGATVAPHILQQQQARPSVIVCAPASGRDSPSCGAKRASGSSPTAPRIGGTDEGGGGPGGVGRPGWQPALDEAPSSPRSPVHPLNLTASIKRMTSIAGSVDDHFRQSLGDLWLQIQATESTSPLQSASPLTSLSPLASV